jgi:Gas vesicle synthesis protein GvpL/GvpF
MRSSGTAYYLYCLTPCLTGVPSNAIGVDGQPGVMVRDCGGIGAVFSQAELSEFCGESGDAHLQDLAWLGPRVCRHEAVVEEISDGVPVLPARFATLFTSLESLQRFVLEHRDAVTGFFTLLGDQQEWAVKGLLDRGQALQHLTGVRASCGAGAFACQGPGPPGRPAADERAPAVSPGARYFDEKRMQAQWERDFNFRLREFCRRAAAALAEHAGGFRERKVLAPVEAAPGAEAVLNWAFLVSPAALDEFRVCLARFNEGEAFPGLMLTPTGPWPPYSFVPELSVGAAA